MKTTHKQRRVASFLSAIVLLLQITPALAGGPPEKENKRSVVVTFTKWRTAGVPAPPAVPLRSLFAGFVGGDLGAGDFVGEVLDRKVSTPCTVTVPPCTPGTTPATITIPINALDAIYEVQAGDHSFIALIQGGSNGVTGAGLLDGVILAGWRTGARVHVEFKAMTNCPGAPAGTCFQGTIRILSDSDD